MDVGIKTANDQFQSLTTTERTAITSPVVGQCVWDSDLRQIMVYMNATTGNAWQPIGNSIVCASTTRPVTPFEGQEIYETDTNRSWTYNGAAFVPNDNVFTTEAARDAAITSPTEGMIVYLTASTETAAAGSTTYVPTGIQTIYNGTGWVTITPTGTSQSGTGATTLTSGSSVLTGSPGTVPTVTLRTGTTVLVSSTIWCVPSTTNAVYVAIANAPTSATGVSGNSVTHQYGASPAQTAISGTGFITGLTAGLNTFYQHYSVSSGSANIYARSFTVQGIA